MDKNAIKKYAVWARRELISRVSQKALQYGITDKEMVPANAASVNGVVLSADEMKQRRALIERIHANGYEQTIEEVAYTWFNRFIALRFMEVNGYLPSRVRVFTDENNAFNPQILTEAIHLDMDGLDMEKVYAFKDANDKDGLFKYLLIVQCNALSPILPGMFQRIADETELLFPDNLLREGSVIERMVVQGKPDSIPEKDWTDQVQIIGWLYQYYNSEKKDKVFAALKKNVKITKENIPAATQLFTPDWIVRYMVENSLGRLWVEGHPNDALKSSWKYYLEEAEQERPVQEKLAEIRKEYAALTPEQIKVIDPCCGSGHILAYLFDVLMQIYESYGYTTREAVASILAHNLYGLDIDDRAAQLSYFAVMMKARQYDRRFLTRKDEEGNPDVPQPHVYAICESNTISRGSLKYFGWSMSDIERNMALEQLTDLLDVMEDAKEYGSILIIKDYDWELLYHFVGTVDYSGQLDFDAGNLEETKEKLWRLVEIAAMLAQKYDVVVTNPPYMGSSGMSGKLSDYVKKNYPDSKSDLFACFIEHGNAMVKQNGVNCMVTMQSWMFLSSFEKMRITILHGWDITNLMHMENMVMGIAFGTAVTCFRKSHTPGYKGTYNHIKYEDIENEKPKEFPVNGNRFSQVSTDNFFKIPGSPVAYWVSKSFYNSFAYGTLLKELANPRKGLATTDNSRFLRLWHEVSFEKCGIGFHCAPDACKSQKKWFPLNKGGEYRRWYGNKDYLVNWENNGKEMKAAIVKRYNGGSYTKEIRSENKYFLDSITWSALTAGNSSFRYSDYGALFDSAGSSMFPNCDTEYILGLLNTKITNEILRIINPTLNYGAGSISNIPVIVKQNNREEVTSFVNESVSLSRTDWDSFETSWDFQRHPLISVIPKNRLLFDDIGNIDLAECYMCWENECNERFHQLKANEEELNRIFIDIYGLQSELTPEVEDRDVTVRRADLQRDIKSLISYAVGCMFGRYSLNRPGLVYAGGEWEDAYRRNALADENGDAIIIGSDRIAVNKGYQIQVDGQWQDCTYSPDADNIIPICDDEYFEDDIVGRFIKFIETVYGKQSLESNLRFIADALGGKGQPKEVIRSYFLNEFYSDHCKIYQKRPIYWQFDSGKKNGFKCLIYMHRYREDTIARIRTDYVHEQQSRYRTAIAGLEQRMASASTAERVKLTKQLKKLQEQAEEIHVYEEKIHHLADQMIPIDLDDGVKVNYAKFQDVLTKIK